MANTTKKVSKKADKTKKTQAQLEESIAPDEQIEQPTQEQEVRPVSQVARIVESKPEKLLVSNAIFKIKMLRNKKVSYKSGYLYKGNTYRVEDIEGGVEQAALLIKANYAVVDTSNTIAAHVNNPDFSIPQEDKVSREDAIKQLRKNAQDRRK